MIKQFFPLVALSVFGFSQTPSPTFDVAVIKPTQPPTQTSLTSGRVGINIQKSRVVITLVPLRQVIATAFNVKPNQVVGPEWINNTRFDIEATMPDGVNADQAPLMLQNLLAERFKMVVHKENREQPVYALMVAKGGPKLKEKDPVVEPELPADPGAISIGTAQGQMRMVQGQNAMTFAGAGQKINITQNGVHMEFERISQSLDTLSQILDKPVIDKTELKGNYDIQVDLPLEAMLGAAMRGGGLLGGGGGRGGDFQGGGRGGALAGRGLPADINLSEPGDNSAIFKAVEKLGLKLESTKAQFETIIVDSMEKTPTDN